METSIRLPRIVYGIREKLIASHDRERVVEITKGGGRRLITLIHNYKLNEQFPVHSSQLMLLARQRQVEKCGANNKYV